MVFLDESMSTDSSWRAGLWRLADPKISITSVTAMMIGAPMAARHSQLDWTWLVITGLALFCFEVAKNAWGEVYDYDSGTDLAVEPQDRTDFSGGKRVLVEQLLTRRQTWIITFVFAGMGILLGASIVMLQAPRAIWVGIIGLVMVWSYHGPPLQLAYRGLGELNVALCYGPLISLGTYVVQTNTYSPDVFWLSMPLGFFVAAFLWVNEFPDYTADKAAGKNNLVVKLGKPRASRILPLIYLCGFALLLLVPVISSLPETVWLGFIALPTSLLACSWTWANPLSFYRDKPVQALSLITFALYATGACLGVLIGGA
jgi:1,4-dihydroxy-2-naphthoate octaprenyltransferase